MSQFKRVKRAISGVLLLDKGYGISSNTALQQVKRLFQAEKAGHTGNLDPLATGLLPLCFGEATKFSQYLLDADKIYQAVIKLGSTTTTGDVEGEVISQQPVSASRAQVEQVLRNFIGPLQQIPPMYSALKHEGKALYTYARAGVEIERKAREITIYSLELDEFSGDELRVTVSCSKGTYIRVLAEDIGAELGCGAHLAGLRRISTGGFELANALTLSQLEQMEPGQRDACLLPADCLLEGVPKVFLDRESAYYVQRGQEVWQANQSNTGLVSLYGPGQVFLGLGEITDAGKVAPRRLVATAKNEADSPS
ncbi:tRNA pseudouridine(55) synthase TruB [Acidithiobacillus sp.]|uniref:tRNA pseudouridine(55) synthase TruB n=1 Tax=Acidithiobacillus sp. TaxID=1872118 RepID=UPI00258682DC|nr:tRNA pseudouridine(55) synthase TruB [Acidithiobacillus sp.]MDD5376114.1 tRNA pseudouridine(55) synthase TruB [Acidithiobacillus sp.]